MTHKTGTTTIYIKRKNNGIAVGQIIVKPEAITLYLVKNGWFQPVPDLQLSTLDEAFAVCNALLALGE
jgi:hypothetical protein